jgi:flagellar basal-body rod protein FlgF/flagellar basal-body rod protein FlgG
MDSGFYAACTALVSRTQALDTIANNLANASTVGYRTQHNVFSSVLEQAGGATGSDVNQAINNFGLLSGTSLDETQGALQKTGNPLDVAIQGSGFFVVQTGGGNEMYTRNGSLQVSSKGQLVTQEGDPVMGAKGPITLPPGTVSISPDGTISSNGAVAGKLKVVDFPEGTQLESAGQNYYTAPANTAKDATSATVQQGMVESSNVNPVSSMVELINAQRSAEMMQRALSMYNTEIDKTAAQELPKVG